MIDPDEAEELPKVKFTDEWTGEEDEYTINPIFVIRYDTEDKDEQDQPTR